MSVVRVYYKDFVWRQHFDIRDKTIIHKLKNVLRLGDGDSFYVFDGCGSQWLYHIENCTAKEMQLTSEGAKQFQPRDSHLLTLGFPLLKQEKIDFILQKATELGVHSFLPFRCQRSLQFTPTMKKRERWMNSVIEATRQSGRLWLPTILDVHSLIQLQSQNFKLKLMASQRGCRFDAIAPGKTESVLVIIGPEGDFTEAEYTSLRDDNFVSINLSQNILRSETAALTAVALLSNTAALNQG